MKQSIFVIAGLISFTSFSQTNLVKNAGFTTDEKITHWNQIEKAEGWSNSNAGTVDLYTAGTKLCTRDVNIPKNFWGEEASDGNYAGIVAHYDDQRFSFVESMKNMDPTSVSSYQAYGEYLQGEITEPLVAGKTYTFAVKVSLAERGGRAVEGLGVYFSKEKLDNSNNKKLSYTPQVLSTKVIDKTDGWEVLSGTFTAEGGEAYFSIGAFEGSSSAVKTTEELKEDDYKKAYYYVYGPQLNEGSEIANFDDILDGEHVIFLSLNFETGKSDIKASSHDELNACAEFLKAHPDVNIQIDGHTDATGTDEINIPLSKDRAAEVKKYLVNQGVEADRMSTEGYGSSRPLYTEKDNDVRNRRMELYQKK